MGYTISEVFFCPNCGTKLEIVEFVPETVAPTFISYFDRR
jgi:hypothetical protein